jgi:hypothetical protein
MIAEADRTVRHGSNSMRGELKLSGPAWGEAAPSFGIGTDPSSGARVLAPIDDGRLLLDEARVVPVPQHLADETAILVPLVAEALRVWDLLRLEIGAAALVTRALPWAPLLDVTASWYGAVPVEAGSGRAGEPFDSDTVGRLTRTLAAYPGVCVVELTGRAEIVDMVLETVPTASRVMFAGPAGDRLTIDYYVNVHRKGLHLASTVLSPLRSLAARNGDAALTDRAIRLLTSPSRAQACRDAAAAGVPAQ